MSSCKQHCRRPLLKGSCFIVWLAQFCKPCLQGEYVYIIHDRNIIHPVYTFTLLFLVHPSSHPSICGSFSTYLLILLYLPIHLFAHLPIYLSNYFYIFLSNYRNTWIISSQYVISSENGIKTHQHLLQFLPGRGFTSTWRTDLVCFPYIQHIIANISMSTASSKRFMDHVKTPSSKI